MENVFIKTNLGLKAEDGNAETHQGSNTQTDDDRFSVVEANKYTV